MISYIDANIDVRLRISQLLLKGILDITMGFNDFRIYLTDLTFDNVVVNENLTKVSFIDLDNVIIIDTRNVEKKTHIHQKIDCDGCFVYSPKEICEHEKSDLNIFAACQLLNEDLFGDISKGFLHSLPEDFLVIREKLSNCVNCIDCDRFQSASELINLFEQFIKLQ